MWVERNDAVMRCLQTFTFFWHFTFFTFFLIFRSVIARRCPNRPTIGNHFRPYVCPSVHKKFFFDFALMWCMSRPRPDMSTSVTSTRSKVKVKVKVTDLLKFRKLHFSTSISSTILAWGSKLMVGHHSMGPSLQLVGVWFSNCLLRKVSREFKLRRMSIFHEIQMAIFRYCAGYSQTVGHAGSPMRIVHVGMTLTRSKVKVKVNVTALLKLRKLHFSRSISSAILAWNSKLMVDRDSIQT